MNAGGVISSYAEHMGYDSEKMFEMVKEKVTAAATEVIGISLKNNENPRAVALRVARERIEKESK